MPSSRYYRFKTMDREEKIKKFKILFFLLSIFGFIMVIFWLIFISSFFDIQNINLSDNTALNRDNVENIILNIMPLGLGKNLLIVSKASLKSRLIAAFPQITDVTIKKKLFHTIIIDFKKRIQTGIWCQSETGTCFYFDKDGVIFAEAPQTEGSLILKIKDGSKNNISLGDQVLDSNQINFIFAFSGKIAENNKFKILEFKIKPSFSIDLEAVTDKNWSIYLDEKQEPIAAANNLLSILEEVDKNKENIEYIDLRISNRVFYCPTNKPCATLTK